jgi:ABC-type lipoprotein release transport system permease subunit
MKARLIKLLIRIKNSFVKFISHFSKRSITTLLSNIKDWLARIISFVILLSTYLATKALIGIMTWKHFPQVITRKVQPHVERVYFIIVKLNSVSDTTINRVNLIELALKNMRAKMARTIITIGGMSVGIAAIVFLVSVGYGLQELVTSRVARLEEMRQAEVSTQPGSNVKITDDTLKKFREMPEVEYALPVIALVGKVNYKNSVTDMAVYGVTKEYLKQSAVRPLKGTIFDSDELTYTNIYPMTKGEVAGASTVSAKYGDVIGDAQFTIAAEQWIPVKEKPQEESKLLGYTKRSEGQQTGVEVWGGSYSASANGRYLKDAEGNYYGKWVKSKVLLWQLQDRKFKVVGNGYGGQSQIEGFLPETYMTVKGTNIIEASVLGLSTDVTESTESSSSNKVVELSEGWVYIEGEVENPDNTKVVKIPLPPTAKRKAVVNMAVLNVLGINENEAVGSVFQVSFVLTNSLLNNESEKVESEPTDYEIVAVIPSDNTPLFYVPFIDLKSLGITNYSQIKVGVKKDETLPEIRKKIEAAGYITTSVADTVAQIDSLFGTIRKILALVGTVALAVASLGMFNTLTVSLLERTREIGLMKSMGMRSKEVEELFLSESMVMGFFGGVIGLIGGALAGKLLGLVLSMFAMFKGVGFINISTVPPVFTILIISLSLFVGLATGIYPAKRATGISALNALRYE